MNGCEHYQELISRMIDDELSVEEKEELTAHLDVCEDCAALYTIFENVSKCIQEDAVEAPIELCEEVMASLRRENIRKKNIVPWKKLLAAAACLAVILLAGATILPTMGSRASTLTAAPTVRDSDAAESVMEESISADEAPAVFSAPAPAAAPSTDMSAQSGEVGTPEAVMEAESGSGSAGENNGTDKGYSTTYGAASVTPAPTPAYTPAATPAPTATPVEILIPQDTVDSVDDSVSVSSGKNGLMLAAAPPNIVELGNHKRWTQLTTLLSGEETEFDLEAAPADKVYDVICLNNKDLKMTVFVYGEELYYHIETVVKEGETALEAENPLLLAKCKPADFVKFIEAK